MFVHLLIMLLKSMTKITILRSTGTQRWEGLFIAFICCLVTPLWMVRFAMPIFTPMIEEDCNSFQSWILIIFSEEILWTWRKTTIISWIDWWRSQTWILLRLSWFWAHFSTESKQSIESSTLSCCFDCRSLSHYYVWVLLHLLFADRFGNIIVDCCKVFNWRGDVEHLQI